MCLCYCVLGFAAHSFISGDDSDCEDSGCDYDRYDYMGYGTDLEEYADEFSISPETLYYGYSIFKRCCKDFYILYF